MSTILAPEVQIDQLLQFAHGTYQRALLLGQARWSGADLRGRAARYGGRYAASRANLRARLEKFGYEVVEIRGDHNRRIVRIGSGTAQYSR